MFKLFFYQPLYNALIFLSSIVPGGDVGLAIILLTILVKLFLLPLYHKVLVTQKNLKKIEPELKSLQEKYKNNREELARRMMELYQKYNVNPFTSFFIILIQIPIVIALFLVFRDGVAIRPELLYSFVQAPAAISPLFLNFIDITSKSLILAIFVGLTQFIQMKLSLPATPLPAAGGAPSFKEDFSRSMNINLKYVMPVFIAYIAYTISTAISLYWITSNIFSIGQELYVRRKLDRQK